MAEAGDGQVELTWDEPSDEISWPILGYNIFMGKEEGCETMAFTVPRTDTHLVGGLENGVEYFFRASSFNALDESPLTSSVSAIPHGIPGPPVNFTVTAGLGHVALTWEPPLTTGDLELVGYRILKGISTADMAPLINISGTLSYDDIDVVNGTLYYYKVQAYHRLAMGVFTTTKIAKPFGPPGSPVDVMIASADGRTIISWTPPFSDGGSPIEYYVVHRGTAPDDLSTRFVVPSGTSYNDLSVYNGITYHYAVSAVNGVQEGPWSLVVSATPIGLPGAPSALALEEGDSQVKLTWLPPDNIGGTSITGYTVLRGGRPEDVSVLVDLGDTTEYIDSNVLNGKEYFYSVLAHNALGQGPPTAVISTVPMAPPLEPEGLSIVLKSGHTELLWLPPAYDGGSAILAYRIYRGVSPEDLELVVEVTGTTTRYEDHDVVLGTEYWYTVTAVNHRFEGEQADVRSLTVTGPPGALTNVMVESADGSVVISWQPPTSTGGLVLTGYLRSWARWALTQSKL
jgi:titin